MLSIPLALFESRDVSMSNTSGSDITTSFSIPQVDAVSKVVGGSLHENTE